MLKRDLRKNLVDQLVRCWVPRETIGRLGAVLEGDKEPRATLSIEALRRWFAGDKEAPLVLLGGAGCGKTFAACWSLTLHVGSRAIYLRTPGDLEPDWFYRSAMYQTASELAGRSAFDFEDREHVRQLTKTSLLILDELGTEIGDAERSTGGIVLARYAANLPTILVSNLTADTFGARYGKRILSRVRLELVHGADLRQEDR